MAAMRRSRLNPVLVLCFVYLLATTMAVGADRFVSGIPDLPLMPGLEEIDGSTMVFSKPQGRIIEVAARGAVTRDAVRAFYGQTLPQLGWRKKGPGRWHRESEVLSFDVKDGKQGLVVQFSIVPQ